MTTAANTKLGRAIAMACVLALVATAALWWIFAGMNERKVTAHFAGAVGVYPGGDVRVLGVKVGTIDEVVPEGKTVRVVFFVDRDVRIPQNAQAVVLPYDGVNPLPPQYCYLKPHYLDVHTSYFDHLANGAL